MHHCCRPRLRVRPLFLALLAAMPLLAQAQTTPDGDDGTARKKTTTLDAVNVKGQQLPAYTVDQSSAATRLPLTLQDTPQSISVITSQRMTDQDLTSVRAMFSIRKPRDQKITRSVSYAVDCTPVVLSSTARTEVRS